MTPKAKLEETELLNKLVTVMRVPADPWQLITELTFYGYHNGYS